MQDLVYHRRKFLNFDHPLASREKPYVKQLIPKYYSSFYPWFRTYNEPPLARTPICSGVYSESITHPTQLKFLPKIDLKINWIFVIAVMYLLFLTIM